MGRRRLIFKVIVGSIICLFFASAFISTATMRLIFSWPGVWIFWLAISVVSQGPFILIPFDRGFTLRTIFEQGKQWLVQLILAVTLTNLALLFVCPFLMMAPRPNRIYDFIPFLIFGSIIAIVFRSASRVVERRFTLPVDGLNPNWRDITVLHLSDIHAGPFLRKKRLENIISRINAKGGFDLCVITGDVVNHNADDLAWTLPILEKIQAPLGTFATIGNHEYIDNEDKILKIYEKSSIPLLRDNSVLVSDGRHNVRLIGVDFPFDDDQISPSGIERAIKRSTTYSAEIEGELKILLSHHPDGFVGGRELGIPLTLAGHTHGGQVIVMGKNIVSPFMRYKRGIYRKGDKYLYVNSGLGNWMPFRINCPCEFAMIRIVKKEDAPKTGGGAG